MLDAIMQLFETEPTVAIGAIGGIIDAAIVLAVTFGLPITVDQKHAIDGVVLAIGAGATLLVIRSKVTPTAQVASTVVQPK